MSLTPEWRGRVEAWRNLLRELCYVRLGEVPLSGFVTKEQLSPRQAAKGHFRRMPRGTQWGGRWEYCWFRGAVKLPAGVGAAGVGAAKANATAAVAGRRIVLRPDLGNESRVLVNGREAGAVDYHHREILLSNDARPGMKFDLLIETYAGHGATPCGGGPSAFGSKYPETPAKQRTVGDVSFGIWEEEAYQAWVDVQSLLDVRDKLDKNSLRVAEIDAGLREFTLIADLELPRDEMMRTVRAGRKRLRPLLECVNGSTAPKLYCFGHSHIDVAWLWPLAETERKVARTFGTALGLMDEYPEYKFLQSQAYLYDTTKRLYPELYRRLKVAARRGQWIPEGSMWVEADTNLASGESLIRQFLHGKRFYRDEFGVDCRLMWLPDVFGYSGCIPQIMTGCGIRYFSTSKIFWTYNGGDVFPYNTFWWEGIDGTRVLSHIFVNYGSTTNPATLIERWDERVQKDGITSRMVPFGYGDGGGGATRDHLEFLRRCRDLEGVPRAVIESPITFFEDEEARNAKLPVYVGELYYQEHRGTYTTQARTKKGNRKCEFALREAELWGAAAQWLGKFHYPARAVEDAWKGVLLNQFHDIIPGSSIHRVYEEAEALYATVAESAAESTDSALAALTRPEAKSLTVFNSLSWPRTALVPLPRGFGGAELDGQSLPVQQIGGTKCTELTIPACGWTTVKGEGRGRNREQGSGIKEQGEVKANSRMLENEFLRIEFNRAGEMASCIDKTTGQQLAAAPLNSLRMYKDVPRWLEAWDIDSTYKFTPMPLPEKAQIAVVAAGPLAGVLRISRRLNNSQMVQDVWLRRGSRRVEFHTRIDWREKHKMLKVNFPTAIYANEALHEIQFGHISRPNHASRPFDADRFEVCNNKWTALVEQNRGAAVLNDCKYGVNVEGGSINLTLLRATQAPDESADVGVQEFVYAFCAWTGSFFDSGLVREGYELNVPVLPVAGAAGAVPQDSLFQLDAPNVIVETVKPAEDGSGDIIVRLYESKRAATRCTLTTSLPVAAVFQTDMLENEMRELSVNEKAVALEFRPFEIKTVKIKA